MTLISDFAGIGSLILGVAAIIWAIYVWIPKGPKVIILGVELIEEPLQTGTKKIKFDFFYTNNGDMNTYGTLAIHLLKDNKVLAETSPDLHYLHFVKDTIGNSHFTVDFPFEMKCLEDLLGTTIIFKGCYYGKKGRAKKLTATLNYIIQGYDISD